MCVHKTFNVGDKVQIVRQTVNIPRTEAEGFTYTSKIPTEGIVCFASDGKRWVTVDFGLYKSCFFVEDIELVA